MAVAARRWALAVVVQHDLECRPANGKLRRRNDRGVRRVAHGGQDRRGQAVSDRVTKADTAMGKRSNFERREADFYPTPRAAVVPLIPYLRGNPDLCRAVCWRGRPGPASGRVRPALRLSPATSANGQDALRARPLRRRPTAIITNPPYTRDVHAQADRALPGHCANLAAIDCRLGQQPCRRRRSCPTARTSCQSAA